ncbi:GNAT family N-acetyltransferase [Caulobacter mirabilis]|uniref:GNAT family N-acetyltransferase n=1 Tax=Caulobacter mirabilis TaxID=69666 RepID=A0A2D2B190_9CAUL|nr:GNAT family N-acetyltransferase [Caulobacter mirabilis]ATQ44003.1 GNAT family N-acetyltransferase [Caulobacter mirabilis]
MAVDHPLDRPVWSALTGRQSDVALVQGRAVRFAPAYGLFAAIPDMTAESLSDLSDLVRAHGEVGLVEVEAPPALPGVEVVSRAVCAQMVAEGLSEGPPPAFQAIELTDADAQQMLALATLTRPGPFFDRTHQLGAFVGVKDRDRLIAMAGERMRPDGFTEVSGVCTHPDSRGRGYAAGLMRLVAGRILDRGETPFLHAYADHAGTIALYETLGFRVRRALDFTVLAPA